MSCFTDAGDREPVVVIDLEGAKTCQSVERRRRQVGHADTQLGLAEQVVDPAAGQHPAVVDDRDPIAHALDLGQEVAVEEDRRAGLAGTSDDRADIGAADRVERGGRFVEDHEVWVPEQRHRQAESLLHALRVAADGVLGAVGQAHVVERTVDRGGRRQRTAIHCAEPGVQLEDLPRAQPRLVAEELGQVADLAPRRTIAERRAEDCRVAAGRARKPEEQLHRRRLACPVRTEEAEDLARLDAQGQVDQGIGSSRSASPGHACR